VPIPQDTASVLGDLPFLRVPTQRELLYWVNEQPLVEWRRYTGTDPAVTDPVADGWVPPYDDATAYTTQGEIRAWFKQPAERVAMLQGGNVARIDADVVVFSAVVGGDVLIDSSDAVFVVVDVTAPETGQHWLLRARRCG